MEAVRIGPDDLLLARAAGTLAPPLDLLVGLHLRLSPRARARYRLFLELGGLILQELPEDRRALPEPRPPERRKRGDGSGNPASSPVAFAPLPGVLADPYSRAVRRLSRCRDRVARTPLAWPGLLEPGSRAELVRIAPGAAMPRHGHTGLELTLVMRGGYVDEWGRFETGDLQVCDGRLTHAPRALWGQDCLCILLHAPQPAAAPPARSGGS